MSRWFESYRASSFVLVFTFKISYLLYWAPTYWKSSPFIILSSKEFCWEFLKTYVLDDLRQWHTFYNLIVVFTSSNLIPFFYIFWLLPSISSGSSSALFSRVAHREQRATEDFTTNFGKNFEEFGFRAARNNERKYIFNMYVFYECCRLVILFLSKSFPFFYFFFVCVSLLS